MLIGRPPPAKPSARDGHAPKPRAARAFTLVELLVVVGIIAVLISILLPSLNKARRSAQAVTCESQLRQIAIAALNYAAANRNALQLYSVAIPNGTRALQYSVIDTTPNPTFSLYDGSLSPYLNLKTFEGLRILECPALVNSDVMGAPLPDDVTFLYRNGTYQNTLLRNWSYGPNVYINPPYSSSSPFSTKLNNIRLSAETIMFTDSAQYNGGTLAGLVRGVASNSPYGQGYGPPRDHGRHDGRAGVAWVDGHASLERVNLSIQANVVASSDYPNYVTAKIGYITPNDKSPNQDLGSAYYYLLDKQRP